MEIINMRVGGNLEGLKDFVKHIQKFGDTKEMTLLEIGSFKGESSEIFAQNFKRITCVDSWVGASVEMYLDTCTPQDIEDAFDKRMKPYDNVKKMKMTSQEAAEKIKGKFDIVYIDAAHDYGNVKLDITLWSDRAKLIISGHDYSPKHKGVIRAVDEIFYCPDEKFKDNTWLVWIKKENEDIQCKWDSENMTSDYNHTDIDISKLNYKKFLCDIPKINYEDKTIIDYGIGGGWIAKILTKYKKYIGYDVSKKVIEFAEKNLENIDNKEINHVDISPDYKKHNADYFISLACIQHFPSIKYLYRWLYKVNNSGSGNLILQYRCNAKNEIKFIDKNVMTYACILPQNFIDKFLTNYTRWGGYNDIKGNIINRYAYYKAK